MLAHWGRLVGIRGPAKAGHYVRVETTLSQTLGADWSRSTDRWCERAGSARGRAVWNPGERHEASDPNLDGRLRTGDDWLQPGAQTDWRSARSKVRRSCRHQIRLQHPRLRLSQ